MAKGFIEILKERTEEHLEPRIREVFRQTAVYIFERISRDDFLFDSQTYNLNASIGIGVFKDGVLTDWITNPLRPTQLKKFIYKGQVQYIDGQQALNEALGAVGRDAKEMGKWVMILIAAVPWAYLVDIGSGNQPSVGDKRGKGWWSNDLAPDIVEKFRRNAKALL